MTSVNSNSLETFSIYWLDAQVKNKQSYQQWATDFVKVKSIVVELIEKENIK